ncbi:hypothetical protein [Actinomadura sp. HBU206391]|uniref:hypothetical protein n=1 Tax=Actinomadura sp. HBU206391 TaxID=2731692 RepID=UPI00164F8CA0|nr:hypothetical protein [Actinomadura sp. HBU206391]MBC6462410.1 hypothetical protein [Actinomadura sp. HBU206391]
MSELPRVVFLLVWESQTAGDALCKLLDELATLRDQADLRRRWADDWRRRGDHLMAMRCTDCAEGIEYAAFGIEEALFEALDLWQQYEQQDP